MSDDNHRHATDRVSGTVVAECPNIDDDPDAHLSFTVEYSDSVHTTIFEELMDEWPACGKCGAEMQAMQQQEQEEVLD